MTVHFSKSLTEIRIQVSDLNEHKKEGGFKVKELKGPIEQSYGFKESTHHKLAIAVQKIMEVFGLKNKLSS